MKKVVSAIALFLLAAGGLHLPIVSGYLSGKLAGCDLLFRAYNLMEVSPWAWGMLVLPLWLAALPFVKLPRRSRGAVTGILCGVSFLCLCAGAEAARGYLLTAGAEIVYYHFGLGLHCVLYVVVTAVPLIVSCHWDADDADMAELCDRFFSAGCALEGRDESRYGLFLDALFWANEYARALAMENIPALPENQVSYEETGALARRRAHLENCRETFLGDLKVILERMPELLDALSDEEFCLSFACYLALYLAERTAGTTETPCKDGERT